MAFFDQAIDPITRDFTDTDTGDWDETEDSRTAVLMQLEIRLNEWAGDPSAGSRIHAMLEDTTPTTAEAIRDEALRALQVLVDEGMIDGLAITIDQDELGRATFVLYYKDRASGRAVDLVYSPFGG